MKKPFLKNLRAISPVLLILGLIFFVVALVTDQNVFTLIAIAFLVVSLVAGGRWLRMK